jgi:thiamine kinase-like enzyme
MDIGITILNKKNKKQLNRCLHYFYKIDPTIQSYFPYLSTLSNHNFNNIRLNHKYELIRLLYKKQMCTIHGRVFVGLIYSNTSSYSKRYVFVKELSILPYLWINLFKTKKCQTINNIVSSPLQYQYNQFLHSIYNSAYIDVFGTYLCSKLVENRISPHFPLFYGTTQTIFKKYSFEIEQDELHLFRDDDNKLLYSDHTKLYKHTNDYIVQYSNIPVQLLFIEKISHSFDDFLDKSRPEKEWMSVLFQVVAAIYTIQNKYSMCHNDLHIGNVMYSHTNEKYLYYTINNIYYRVPTYNKIIKIIDFGRATFQLNNTNIYNTIYQFNNEAHTLFNYNHKTKPVTPSYHFDIALFACSLLIDASDSNIPDNIKKYLHEWIFPLDIHTRTDISLDFKLYRKISKNKTDSFPKDIIDNYFSIWKYNYSSDITNLYKL